MTTYNKIFITIRAYIITGLLLISLVGINTRLTDAIIYGGGNVTVA